MDMNADRPAMERLTELLAGYSAGTLSPASTMLVASHMAMSNDNLDFVQSMDAFGGTLLEDGEGVALTHRDAILSSILDDKLAVEEPEEATDEIAGGFFPLPLRQFLGKDLDEIEWKSRLPGLKEFEIETSDGAHVSLLWIRAGQAVPTHTHDGTESTLILQGGFTDETGHYERGDIAIADESVDHRPVADPDEDCICLAVLDAPVRLTGPLGRFIQPFLPR